MKDKIVVTKGRGVVNLFLITEGKKLWLLSHNYSAPVYDFFKNG